MDRTANSATAPAKRVAAITGFTIPVGKWRKLSGEPTADAKSTDYLIVPAGAIGRFPSDKWGEFGSVRTYRFWKNPSEMPPPNVVAIPKPKQDDHTRSPCDIGRDCGTGRGYGNPYGRRGALSCVRNLSKEDKEAAAGLLHLGKNSGREDSERKERTTSPVHPELLDLCSEGGSESSSRGDTSGDEEEQESGLSGSDGPDSEYGSECGDGPSRRTRTRRLHSENGSIDEESDCPSGQEDEDDDCSEESDILP